jgi:hypothetical protein
MPRFQQGRLLLPDNTPDSAQFTRAEAQTVIVSDRIEPKLSHRVVTGNMYVERFVAVRRVEKEPIRTAS